MENSGIAVITIPLQEWNDTKNMLKNINEKMSKLAGQEEKELLTPNEVCKMLKISRSTFQRHVIHGILEPVKVNQKKYSKIYVRRSEIENLMNEGKV
ncbi:hypothetical protein EZS27_016698 [termite gut metagenome]|uniref:Helix-turn-helix domain-containing protein n=1 Tax=termite gut metagenome TaxID=433724 RepID=A0A5J4RNN9_9ZZZZ